MSGGTTAGAPRPERRVESEGGAFRAIDAWRSASGHGLCYFVALGPDGSTADRDDRRDRRAVLGEEEDLDSMSAGELADRLEEGVPLTTTERRFRAPDGRLWLGQSEGPVWAEAGTAEGATGILFTSLEGVPRRGRSDGGHVGRMSEEELREAWERAFDSDDGGAERQ